MAELPHEPIASLEANRSVDSVYCLFDFEQRLKKNGEPYFTMNVGDATGRIQAVKWDEVGALQSGQITAGGYVRIQGFINPYRDSLQLTVQSIERVDEKLIEPAKFRAVSHRPLEEMEAELDEWIGRVQNKDLRTLLDYMFAQPGFRERYCAAPAAARVHQAYLHGLLEHTLAVMQLAWGIAKLYKPINLDLLITGALLHDVGKIRELDWRRGIGYTDQGRLFGHIYIGATMIDRSIRNLELEGTSFDPRLHQLLIHMILSHHGRLEYGSPAVPKIREAIVLHYADYTEAYMAAFAEDTNKAASRGSTWTPYNKMFQSYLMTGIGLPPGLDPDEEAGGTDPLHLMHEGRPDPIEDLSEPTEASE